MKSYRLAAEATKDLDEILNYFLSRNIEAGERFVQQFTKKCQNLVQFPEIGRRYDSVAPDLRGIPIQNYIILYKLVMNGIIIVRVVSGYRNLEILFSDDNE